MWYSILVCAKVSYEHLMLYSLSLVCIFIFIICWLLHSSKPTTKFKKPQIPPISRQILTTRFNAHLPKITVNLFNPSTDSMRWFNAYIRTWDILGSLRISGRFRQFRFSLNLDFWKLNFAQISGVYFLLFLIHTNFLPFFALSISLI